MEIEAEGADGRLSAAWRMARGVATGSDQRSIAQRASAIALAIRLTNAALAYFAQVVLARLMGQFEYGVFAYTWVWFMVFAATATLGFGDSPIRFIAQLRERGEDDYLRGFIRFAPAVAGLTSCLAGLAIIIALHFSGSLLDNAYVLPMMLMAVSLPFACIQSFLEGLGRSYNWTIPALLPVYVLRHGLLLVFMVLAVSLGFAANAVTAFSCVVLTLVVSLIYQAAAMLLRLRGVVKPGPRAYRAREWISGSAPFSLLYGSANLFSFADVLVLSFFVSPAEIAIYFAATRIIQVVALIPYAATVGTAHLFSAIHTRGDHEALQRLVTQVSRWTFLIAALSCGAIILSGKPLLGMFGDGFEAGYLALLTLAVGVITRVAAGPSEDVLNMTGHGHVSAGTYLVVVVVNMALAAVLITAFGVEGAAIATSCSLTGRALWLSWAVRRRLGIDPSVISLGRRRARSETTFGEAIRAPAE